MPEASTPATPSYWTAPGGATPALLRRFCHACGTQNEPRAEICPKCGVRQLGFSVGSGKDRVVAAALALLFGAFGIHKFYMGKVAQGVLYLVFFWTAIPGLIGWIEGISYLAKGNGAWAQAHGGHIQTPNPVAIGLLWVLALLPLLAILAILSLIFLGNQVSTTLDAVGRSI